MSRQSASKTSARHGTPALSQVEGPALPASPEPVERARRLVRHSRTGDGGSRGGGGSRAEGPALSRAEGLGAWLRQLRHARRLPLRSVAAASEIDTTLLSKIELGQRLPTETQTRALANFFNLPIEELAAKRIAEKFWKENQRKPGAHRAAALINATSGAQRHRGT